MIIRPDNTAPYHGPVFNTAPYHIRGIGMESTRGARQA